MKDLFLRRTCPKCLLKLILLLTAVLVLPNMLFAETTPTPTLEATENLYLLQGNNLEQINQKIADYYPDLDTDEPVRYDNVLWTLAAGLESRNPKLDKSQWQDIELGFPASSQEIPFYQKEVIGHFFPGSSESDRLFILFGATYSTWKRGTWTNKTVNILQTVFNNPAILVFAGHLTPEALSFAPRIPDLNGSLIAADLYQRIRPWLINNQQINKKIGLIGFSGGSNLVIAMLAKDAEYSKKEKAELLFEEGGIAFSPVLDSATTYANLDTTVEQILDSGHNEKDSLTATRWYNLVGWGSRLYWAATVSWQDILALTADSPENEKSREKIVNDFFNEFISVDLRTTARSSQSTDFQWSWNADGIPPEQLAINQGNRHRHYYQRYATFRHLDEITKEMGLTADKLSNPTFLAEISRRFAKRAETKYLLDSLDAPLYLVFAKDDAVLSDANFADTEELSPRIKDFLSYAERFPNISLFTPRYGTHMGYFLDTPWLQATLLAFFGDNS